MTPILVLHGNGGSRTRFLPLLRQLEGHPDLQVYIPSLSGFDGRPLPPAPDYWSLFLAECEREIERFPDGEWVLYGHGIGGSLLLELAAREFRFPSGRQIRPARVILHGCIGASLEQRWFPKLMRPRWVRETIRQLVAAPALQTIWERRLFRAPASIDPALRRQFFADYGRCAAFSVWFDLITPAWYRQVAESLSGAGFHFLWGDQERVVQSQYLPLWQADFPKATFEVVPDWDHFPMLDDPEAFSRKFVTLATAL